MHCLGLSDAMAAILGLLVHGWVPVRIVEDNAVSSGEIDADAAAPGRRNEAEYLLVVVESINQLLPVVSAHRSVQPDINVAVQVQKLFKNVKHFGHLSKDNHF